MKPSTLRSLALTLAAAASVLAGCAQAGHPALGGTAQGWEAVTFSAPNERQTVVLFYGDRDNLTRLVEAGFDLWTADVVAKRAEGTMNARQAELAKHMGLNVQLLPQGKMLQGYDKGYRTTTQIEQRLKELAAQAPNIVQLQDIGDSWEKTQGKPGHDLWALKLGGKTPGKPVVTFAACHHAREIVTPEMVLQEAEYLIANYGKDANVTSWIDNREIYLVPLVNPDGHVHAETGDLWRKNTNNKTGGQQEQGVDLNRNYASAWGVVGDSSDPESDVFRGTAPFSEPETQAMKALLTAHPPIIYLTFHSYSNSVMWPYDSTTKKPNDPRLQILGTALGKQSTYRAYQGCEMYLNGGDDVEWAFDNLKSLAYTVEIGGSGDGFMPPFSKVPQFFKQNQAMMNYSLKVADNPVAAAGPSLQLASTRTGLLALAPVAREMEYFVGQPGRPGNGTPLAATNGQASMPRLAGDRQLVYIHAKGANGIWGPYEAAWSN